MTIFHDIGLWLWRLLPANPILTRVVATGSKRQKHMWARAAYLGVLFFVVIVQANAGGAGPAPSLAAAAKKSTQVFWFVSLAQLTLMSFIAPVFCAGAITQEKDSNTFHILLTTPLSSGQIVLGSLFSRIFFVWVLLLSGVPIFCITMIYGGVTTTEVFQSFGLAACTGLITGSSAIMISFLKIGTRRTIFFFFVGVAVYLLGVGALGASPWGALSAAPAAKANTFGLHQMSWLAPIHPFLSLMVVTGQTPAPDISDVYKYGWPGRWLLAYPQYGYMFLTTLGSALMIAVSLLFVRRGALEGEATWLNRIVALLSLRGLRKKPEGELSKEPRKVWNNPIAWREANTRGSASGGPVVRWAIGIIGLGAGLLLYCAYLGNWWGIAPSIRSWLVALTWIQLAVVLLVVTNTAASTLTRERESLTMEILLTTPLTSNYIIAGMLQGLIRYAIPLISVPAIALLLFAVTDLLRPPPGGPAATIESVVIVPALMTAFASVAAMIGLQFSLLQKRTVTAVMLSVSVVLGVAGGLWACGGVLRNAGIGVTSLIYPFLPFPAIQALVDPNALVTDLGGGKPSPAMAQTARVTRIVASTIAIGVYLLITYSLYRNMVRSFDMTVRKQSS